jgi:hypothetical protein
MKTARFTLAAAAALALTFAVGATEAVAKKGGGHGGWSGNTPPGWGMGKKTGWDDGRPPGWSKGKKKGWKNRSVPPGWAR